jgi:Flp pilus assembly protein TadD
MKKLTVRVLCPILTLLVAGCATTDQREDVARKEPAAITQAPLGSRIKKRTGASPVVGATREDLDTMKMQQGAIQQQIVNNGGR